MLNIKLIDKKETDNLAGTIHSINDSISDCFNAINELDISNKTIRIMPKDPNIKYQNNYVPIEDILSINIKGTYKAMPVDFLINSLENNLYITSISMNIINDILAQLTW
jgi:hypothetical protein